MGPPLGWGSEQPGRPVMRSPRRAGVNQRDARRAFWKCIAQDMETEAAALAGTVSQPLEPRWFREAGGIASIDPAPHSGRYLAFSQREEIALLWAHDCRVREISRKLPRSLTFGASQFPDLTFRGKDEGQGRRAGRRWGTCWRPEQFRRRIPIDYRDDQSMRLSDKVIYQALYIQGRGALQRELTPYLRSGRALRVPQARKQQRAKHFVTAEVMISERPAEIADRAVPGHWEGDLIIGLNRSAISTLVERTTRFTMLRQLPPTKGHGVEGRAKNGPALAGPGQRRFATPSRQSSRYYPSICGDHWRVTKVQRWPSMDRDESTRSWRFTSVPPESMAPRDQ